MEGGGGGGQIHLSHGFAPVALVFDQFLLILYATSTHPHVKLAGCGPVDYTSTKHFLRVYFQLRFRHVHPGSNLWHGQ